MLTTCITPDSTELALGKYMLSEPILLALLELDTEVSSHLLSLQVISIGRSPGLGPLSYLGEMRTSEQGVLLLSNYKAQRKLPSQGWWCTPYSPALGRQRQTNLCEYGLHSEFSDRQNDVETLSQKKNVSNDV